MKKPTPNPMERIELETWRKLIELGQQIRALEPWCFLSEVDLIGFRLSPQDEPVFMSVMGEMGTHYAVAFYFGEEGFHRFWYMQAAQHSEMGDIEYILNTRQLQVQFIGKDNLVPPAKKLFKKLGIQLRQPHAYPVFESFLPGHMPWFIEPGEVECLLTGMAQLSDVVSHLNADATRLPIPRPEGPVLMRVRQSDPADSRWTEELFTPRPPTKKILPNSPIDEAMVTQLYPTDVALEIDLFMSTMSPIGPKNERPWYPYMLLVVDGNSGHAFGLEVLKLNTTLEDLWAEVPQRVLNVLGKHKLRPVVIHVRTAEMETVLQPLASRMGISVKRKKWLPRLSQAQQHFTEHIS